MFIQESTKPGIFDRFCFVLASVVCKRKRRGVNWQSETEVTIDSVQKQSPGCACRRGCSFVFPRSVRSNQTEPGRYWQSAKSQDLPAAHRPFALFFYRSVPKLTPGHAH